MGTLHHHILFLAFVALISFFLGRYRTHGFAIAIVGFTLLWLDGVSGLGATSVLRSILWLYCPVVAIQAIILISTSKDGQQAGDKRFKVILKLKAGRLTLKNIRRGISVMGSAGSGKTESVTYGLLEHFRKHRFCGIIHDYKHFEITEFAYPLWKDAEVDFKVICFDTIYSKVNPIAPKYLPNEESVYEVSRVLLENLLEHRMEEQMGSNRFFTDAAEGLISGLIWKLKTTYPNYCTLPHLIVMYQMLDTESLVAFLQTNRIAAGMAAAFIQGVESERQTAGVKSTLSNAFKKISSQRLFMALSADGVPLNLNRLDRPTIVSVINNPLYEAAYSPIIATIMHTVIKQMSVRNSKPSFLLMEEAPTLRLLNMHRIPATLRSFDIATVYVLQDKVQNDMMYGDKGSRAVLSNLSYQFFGKANDPLTARYYEQFFEMIKTKTRSVTTGSSMSFDRRVTTGEREVVKNRASVFYKLMEGEFISFADGKDRKVRFPEPNHPKEKPWPQNVYTAKELKENYNRIYKEVKGIFI
ncbi:type IV secretory system conjugative DNA transfer family protein [Galbibacter sp. BG1]|uniref:type IV secretory system conjugative DNA transfer family protein n=1 Tax=Galbibacter sp. BG1 TaxID=1170699 RepID=UPI0015BFFBAB|nr:type IV secretion system DNA-binding domain-containing protein [Galbibacter sp. BG1]QLE01979.1 type IV secretory system conjugative DNA transfer family protein [Galbibacter sp. BG1]